MTGLIMIIMVLCTMIFTVPEKTEKIVEKPAVIEENQRRVIANTVLEDIGMVEEIPAYITDVSEEDFLFEIPVSSVTGVSNEEAVNICREFFGDKDDEGFIFMPAEEHTGRKIGYRPDGAVQNDNRQYYMVSMLWTGEGESVWSTIGSFAVSADGTEIYELLRRGENVYSLGKQYLKK